MADPEKLRPLHADLTEHQKKLEEIKLRYGSSETRDHPHATEHRDSVNEVIEAAKRTLQSAIEVLGQAGL